MMAPFYLFIYLFIYSGALYKRGKLANCCHNLMQNHFSYLPVYIMFYFIHRFSIHGIFPLSSKVEMAAHYAKVQEVGRLEAV